MGTCFCRCKHERNNSNQHATRNGRRTRNSNMTTNLSTEDRNQDFYMPAGGSLWWKSMSPKAVDILVLDTLNVIGTLVEK